MNGWIYIITNTAVFSFYIVLLIFFLLFFITQPWKKDDTKTLRPFRSLVWIFTARADAHNTIAPLPTFKLRLQKINNPVSGKKLVPLYPGFLMYPAFFDRPMITTFTTKQITVKKQSLPLMNMPGFRMSLISISLCRFYSTPKRQFLS
jgi:hypothetical protein